MGDVGAHPRLRGSKAVATPSDRLAAQQQYKHQQTFQHASCLTPISSRVEKLTPTRLPLSRHSLHRSSSSLSSHHRQTSGIRPLSWHSDPRLLQQYLTMAYNHDQPTRRSVQIQQCHQQQYLHHGQAARRQNHLPPYQQYPFSYGLQASYSGNAQSWMEATQQQQSGWPDDQSSARAMHSVPATYQHSDLNQTFSQYPCQSQPQIARTGTEARLEAARSLSTDATEEPLGTVLVGLGLYDRDTITSTSSCQGHTLTALTSTARSPGKGLKLEEPWQPSAEDDTTASSPPASSPVPELDSSPTEDPYPSFETERDEYYEDSGPSYSAASLTFDGRPYSHHNEYVYGSYYAPQPSNMPSQPLFMAPTDADALYADGYYSADEADSTFKLPKMHPGAVSHDTASYPVVLPTMWRSTVPQWNM